MSHVTRYLLTGIFFAAFCAFPVLTFAEGICFSIQAGAYKDPANAEAAYYSLLDSLDENDRASLRIEKFEGLHKVRVGRCSEKTGVPELLRRVRELFPDAFVVRDSIPRNRVFKLYAEESAGPTEMNKPAEIASDEAEEERRSRLKRKTVSRTNDSPLDRHERSAAVIEKDRRARARLQKMSKNEIEELNRKLARALTLYYDKRYKAALPLFKEISRQAETMDVAFWYALCALGAGETDTGIKKLKEMLEVDPGLHRVRLELATAYYSVGAYDDARREFREVLQSGPPEEVKKKITPFMAVIDERTRKFFPHVIVSQGVYHDSNVSAGPDKEVIDVPGGGILTVEEGTEERSDTVTFTHMAGSLLYDIGGWRGLMWDTRASFYRASNRDEKDFDFSSIHIATGPWWIGRDLRVKAPVGYTWYILDNSELFSGFDFSPEAEISLHEHFGMSGFFSISRESYDESGEKGRDKTTREGGLGPLFYFNNRSDRISLLASVENAEAREDVYSYDAINLEVSYLKSFPWNMSLYCRYKYSDRDYELPVPLWTDNREDRRHSVYAVLHKDFLEYFFASAFFNWIDNNSNAGIYDYHKNIYGVNVGFQF